MKNEVNVWEEEVLIPTYGIGEPEKIPMFLENRVYQGSSGVVYPYPVIEKIEDHCEEKSYRAVFMENKYLKIMILPELGGRVQMAYDKLKERHFIYYNQVIKPALVGLTGPWISGGIEFNWPQHHRPSTFLPVDYTIERCSDGSAVVWVNERERMFHQKGMAGFTLHPDRAVLEIQGKVSNPTPVPQTFLWWANPAVKVNDAYQSVFPADVNAVFDHGKRDVSRYPIATGTYYKMDYSSGVDISRYKNIPVPTSYMAIQSAYNFVGGYENDTKAGVLHVANHHISPGKKQWTWGNGDFGCAWDRNLTDEDGPYIELMTGVYTDNQPDFSWLQPYEEKRFTQYFMPYRELGVVKNATEDLLMNIEMEADGAVLKLFATRLLDAVRITVSQAGQTVFEAVESISPEKVMTQNVAIANVSDLRVEITSADGISLLLWESEPDVIKELPEAAQPALAPESIKTTEELYMTGLHLEQYRHATYASADYYEEALRRDPLDIRSNNALGLLLFRKGQFAKAEGYLRKSICRLTERNPNPCEGEPFYNLGLALKYQNKRKEAYDYFYKACWNGAWQDAGYFSLAQLSAADTNWKEALAEIDKSLPRNWHNLRARHLKTTILRKLGKQEEALSWLADSLQLDPFNFGCSFEHYLLTKNEELLSDLAVRMRTDAHNFEELAIDYASAGCWKEALDVVEWATSFLTKELAMLTYYKSWFLIELGRTEEARQAIQQAEAMPLNTFFPNTLEAILALQAITALAPAAKAYYYLGNIWYDKRQYQEAMDAWEQSSKLDDSNPIVWRNRALAAYNKQQNRELAVQFLEKAFFLNTHDARMLMELDQLYKKLNRTHAERLAFLEQHFAAVQQRDDLYLEYITLLNQTGDCQKAIHLLDQRKFHPWEGGEGKVPAQYQLARLQQVRQLLTSGDFAEGLKWIEDCFAYPDHLGEGKLQGAQENEFNYYKGCLLEGLGEKEVADRCFSLASCGLSEPAAAIYYNDQKPESIFFQGLSLLKLGKAEEARSRFNKLIDYGEKHLFDTFKMDYFAVSLPDLQIWEEDMNLKNRVHCYYLMALGYTGLNDSEKAIHYFDLAHALDLNHQGVQIQMGKA